MLLFLVRLLSTRAAGALGHTLLALVCLAAIVGTAAEAVAR